jgi:CBS domain-containing protein
MAVAVEEVMNHEMFSVGTDDLAEHVMRHILALGITGAPVLDAEGRPVGFVSLRDLTEAPAGARVASRMGAPVELVQQHATIREAAERMAESSRHHLVVVDAQGLAVGVIGSLDVVRGLIGRPTPHPDAFPHFDPRTGLVWSNDEQLSFAAVATAPNGPGVYVLIEAQAGRPNRVVWSEGTDNVRLSLRDLLARPARAPGHVIDAALGGRLWFRCASTGAHNALATPGSGAPP